jgi:hypothetical protein
LLGRIGEATAGTNQQTKEKEMTVTLKQVQEFYSELLDENGTEEQLLEQRIRLTESIYIHIDNEMQPSEEHVAEMTAALQKDIQLRDFVLGLPSERPIEAVNKYLGYFIDTVPNDFIAPVASILASNIYSMDNFDEAKAILSKALVNDPRYSLAQLLNRVFNSGWPSDAFVTMTHELHPKVKAGMGI